MTDVSIGDIGGGGGKGGGGFDPTAGASGGTFPGMGGFGDPSAWPGSTGSDIPGMGGTYAPDTAYTPDSAWGGPPGSFGPGGTTTDPNTAAAQAQQPTPGTSPTSIGGTQSGTAQPGAGGQGSQFQKMIQDAVKQLQQGGQQSQQQNRSAAPSALSPTLSDLSNMTQTALQPPQPNAQDQQIASQELGYDPQANFPGQQAQDTEQPFPPGRQDTGPTGSAEEGKPMPDQTINIGQGFGGGSPTQQQDVTAAPPGPSPQATHPSVNWADFPENQQAAATPDQVQEGPQKPETTTPPATTAPTTAPTEPAPTGPVSSRGQAPGAQPPGAQGFNPFRALIDVLTGNFADLNRMAQEANPNAYPYGGTQPAAAPPAAAPPPRQDTGTTPPPATGPQVAGQPPTAGSAEVNRKPGAPDADPNTPDDGFKAQRQEWYKTHDRADPFPHDVAQGFQGGPLAGRPDTQQAAQGAQTSQGAQTPAQNASYIGQYGGHSTLNGVNQSNNQGLNPQFSDRLAAAGRAYKQETGQDPKYGEGYRDDATQQKYWHQRGDRYDPRNPAARPRAYGGRGSLHETGQAMDMPDGHGFTRWLQQGNAKRFGLGFPVPNDPNHIQMANLRGQAYPYSAAQPLPPGQNRPPANVGPQQQMGFASPQEAQQFRQTVAQIESSNNPNNRTGNQYGLYQFSPDQFRDLGITNWRDRGQQDRALTIETTRNRQAFVNQIGREPTGADLYMMHQQGAGAINHLRNPDAPAWQNMRDTAEGRQKGDRWARAAISGNIPRDDPLKRVPVDQITSKQFTDMWARKFNRFGGQQAPAQAQQPPVPTVQQPPRQRGIPPPQPGLASLYGMDWV
jgi:hypothetical protein